MPKLGIISVGKNDYGHQAPSILQLFTEKQILVLRTDKSKDIELISDGKSWSVKPN